MCIFEDNPAYPIYLNKTDRKSLVVELFHYLVSTPLGFECKEDRHFKTVPPARPAGF
jgi:hypothetical protein